MREPTPFEELLRAHTGLPADSLHARWLRGQELFAARAYREAAVLLHDLLEEAGNMGHEMTDARLLLARAYFHSAQLDRTVETATALLAVDPTEGYAHLLAGRALQRQGRHDEAAPHLRLATLLGDYAN